MSNAESQTALKNKATVEKMWQALSDMNWETLKSCMHPDIYYQDMPSDDPGAHGPENTVKRLSTAFNHLAKQEQITHHIVAEGDVVFIDHTEKWTFKSGETAEHTFATMHEMKDGKVYRWSDYWDMNKFISQFPDWFIEVMAQSSAEEFQ